MAANPKKSASAYDKYINYKYFSIAAGLFIMLLLIPIPGSMRDVAVEYSYGKEYVLNFYSHQLFGKPYNETEQWQAFTAQVLEANMRQGALSKERVMGRSLKQVEKLGISVDPTHYEKFQQKMEAMDQNDFLKLMKDARELRHEKLSYEMLSDAEKNKVDRTAKQIKVCFALVAFVITCFVTEAMPLPGVAFCIGLVLVFSGVVSRQDVASLYWSDACWFIMGSLMFAAAFVKTGVDKRICLLIFRSLAKPKVLWITGIMVLVISPAASFISDHALAAMFLPIAIILYNNSLNERIPVDPELAKMLMITIAMACNIGGFGSPSGGARNVIMMTYMEDMFGYSMGYGQWVMYGMPYVIIMMPILWVILNWRFKPQIKDLSPALATLKQDISRTGGWNRKQITAVIIFVVMLVGWITEKNILLSIIGTRLGIGVIAVAGAIAYLIFGVVNWRDYQEKVDWGVVWLYAGAIIFGRVLDSTGTAYWIARSFVDALASIGFASGKFLLAAGGIVTAGMTQLMADGPAAAAVGPITLNMAAVANPDTVLIPFMTLITACASSLAYLLVIGTPPNAIVYASGYLEPKDFLRVGIPCVLIAFIVMMFLALIVWPIIGFAGLLPM